MNALERSTEVPLPADKAFHKFIDDFNAWWPQEYTWSRDKLESILIDGKINGLCTEWGPQGFRCDWGRVIAIEVPKMLAIKWQIGFQRQPVPDPDQASDLEIRWTSLDTITRLDLIHSHFERHGKDGEAYRNAMASGRGWPYLLQRFKEHCQESR